MRSPPTFAFLTSHWTHFVALGFGTGLSPIVPGTVGTLVGFVVHAALSGLPLGLQLAVLAGLFALGVAVCERSARDLGAEDPSAIVWDEVVAFALVLQVAPVSLSGFGAAFLLFRLFDIWKPFPIGWADRHFKGGFGIMVDDVLAAGYSMFVLWHLRGLLHA
jgi:phosphatidylglycerophosphatase A